MLWNKAYRGRALGIVVGIAVLVLLMAGGADYEERSGTTNVSAVT